MHDGGLLILIPLTIEFDLLAEFEAMCMFKSLHKNSGHDVQLHPQGISREEFYSFYEVQGMRWKQVSHIIACASSCMYMHVWYTMSGPIESINISPYT